MSEGDEEIKSMIKPSSNLVDQKSLSQCSEFIDSAKDRLKHLEAENERVENMYRDYEHKVKSKYFPINDDKDTELRIVPVKRGTYDPSEVEKFLESTLKASAKARQIRDELEADIERHTEKKSREASLIQTAANLRAVDEMIQNVAIAAPSRDSLPASESMSTKLVVHLNRL